MDMVIKAATPAERLYAYEQSMRIAQRCGNPGYLWGELDNSGSLFLNSRETMVQSEKAPEFKAEFDAVLDTLRFDERYGCMLKNRATMMAYCLDHSQGSFRNGYEFAFRADTQNYSYLIRCIPAGEDNHVYIYPYRRDCLEQHMKQAEKGIRFIALDGKEKFRVQDGDMIRIITGPGSHLDRMARYVDDCHAEIGGSFYHIREFAEWMECSGCQVIPLRSSLPEKCFSITSTADEIVIITKGERYRRPAGARAEGVTAREGATAANEAMGVTRAQEAAMVFGSIYGWDKPGADPNYYNEQGEPIKFKHRDCGDAR